MTQPMIGELPLLIFDGDCGFCTWSVRQARRWVQPRARIEPWQLLDLDSLGLTSEQCCESVYWVSGQASVLNAGRAVAAVLKSGRAPWPAVGRLMDVRPLRPVVNRAYYLVASYRHRLPGATPACAPG
jgi:predicted DCC family thiol-disulfide oxidoreductase YuxK